ncbi:MAG: lipoprotein insertase outer membrane protein LolB [Burkholderiaceae bacterium]
MLAAAMPRAPFWRAAALALWLQACATHPPPLPGSVVSGRIAVRRDAAPAQEARAVGGEFELSGNASSGQLILTSSIGVTIARARWSAPAPGTGLPSRIELEAQGGTSQYPTLEAMMQDAIGDQLPLAAMFDWLAGRPWPGAAAERAPGGAAFDQLGWRVDLSQFGPAGFIDAQRALPAPTLHVRVKLDGPETPR